MKRKRAGEVAAVEAKEAVAEAGKLPEGWTRARIGERFECWGGMTPSTANEGYWGGCIPWVSSKDIKSSRISGRTEFVTERALKETHLRKCRPGAVLVVVRSGVLVHSLPVAIADTAVVVNQDLKVLDSGDDQLNRWLALALRTWEQQILDRSRKDGTTVQSVRVSDLLDLELPIPPANQMKTLIAKLDSVIAESSATRDHLARVPGILKRFRQAVLAAACSGRLTEDWRRQQGIRQRGGDPAWDMATVHSVCSAVVDCPHSTPEWTSAGLTCLRTTNFSARGLDVRETRFVSDRTYAARIARLEPQLGDIVYSREGGILGIACVIPPGLKACLGQRMMIMRPDLSVVHPEYLCCVLNGPATRRVVEALAGGSASPHLNVADIRDFSVPLPSIREQREICRRVDLVLAAADRIGDHAAGGARSVKAAVRASLAIALRGQLSTNCGDPCRSAVGPGYGAF